jgi:flagellar hook assembly protein FlgD
VRLGSHPNPFNPRTTLAFELPEAGPATLAVIAADGTHVRTLHRGWCAAGGHAVTWDGRDATGRAMASGVYLCRLTSPAGTVSHAVTLVR